MLKLKDILTEAVEGEIKWETDPMVDGFNGIFLGPDGKNFRIKIGNLPLDYITPADKQLLDTLWKDKTSESKFDDYGYICLCYDTKTKGRGKLDSSTLSKVSNMFVDILAAKLKADRVEYVYFQSSKRPVSGQLHSMIAPKIASKMGFQVKQIKSGWMVGKDIFK